MSSCGIDYSILPVHWPVGNEEIVTYFLKDELKHAVIGFFQLYDVINIERPGDGDIARRLTGSSSGAFPFYNRNKKSLTVDMSSEEGKKVFLNLAEQSGVIIDNLGYGAMDRLGLSYEVISKRNPKIIYLSMKGYGKGVYEKRKSLDYPIEVHSGLAYMTGLTGKPMRVGGSLVDMSAAMFGVIAVLNAMIEMRESGVGKYIDIGLFESSVFLMGQPYYGSHSCRIARSSCVRKLNNVCTSF